MKKFRQVVVRKMIGSVGKMKKNVKSLMEEYPPCISQCFSLSGPSEKGSRQAVIQRLSLTCPTLLASFCPRDVCSHFRVVNLEILFFLFQRIYILSRAKEKFFSISRQEEGQLCQQLYASTVSYFQGSPTVVHPYCIKVNI